MTDETSSNSASGEITSSASAKSSSRLRYQEAMIALNQTRYGLSSSIFTSDVNMAFRAMRDFEFAGYRFPAGRVHLSKLRSRSSHHLLSPANPSNVGVCGRPDPSDRRYNRR